jgi:hypothetical protein
MIDNNFPNILKNSVFHLESHKQEIYLRNPWSVKPYFKYFYVVNWKRMLKNVINLFFSFSWYPDLSSFLFCWRPWVVDFVEIWFTGKLSMLFCRVIYFSSILLNEFNNRGSLKSWAANFPLQTVLHKSPNDLYLFLFCHQII